MTETAEFAHHVIDLLDDFGRCEARRMFGGYGIFHQGLMFALIADGSLYLKADEDNRGEFRQAQREAFTYYRRDKPCQLSYYQAPDCFFEDSDACLDWARSAFGAALRKSSGRRKSR